MIKKIIIKLFIIVVLLLTTYISPNQAMAQPSTLCPDGNSINTAIGCIPIGDQSSFMGTILRWGIGVAGGIAFLLIITAGFQIITSAGNPERLRSGQELLTSAISGLILLIFSVFILKLVGINILNLPEF